MHNIDGKKSLIGRFKNVRESEEGEAPLASSLPSSPSQSCRPNSMVITKAHTLIPAHLVAEAISTLHGSVDLRWSGPITPSEMEYVQQYVFAKYPEYSNGLLKGTDDEQIDLYSLCANNDDQSMTSSPSKNTIRDTSFSPSNNNVTNNNNSHAMKIQLEPSKLSGILAKKTSFQGNFVSIPEIQVRNRALQSCGLSERDYLVVFSHCVRESMMMIGESYPFFKGSYYMTILRSEEEDYDLIRAFATNKEAKVVSAPESWLDLRIKGSQLSQYFRKKCKYNPKGLFAYSAVMSSGARSSMHWISEAHRNSWHVLIDASGLDLGRDRLALSLHRPDYVVCAVDDSNVSSHQPLNKITCLLVRKESFDAAAASAAE